MSYVSNSESERGEMLKAIGVDSFADLIQDIPEQLRLNKPLSMAPGKSEHEVLAELIRLATRNGNCSQMLCFLGAGAYDHYIPAAVNPLISRAEFMTAYTPYQAEVAQGTLQAIYEFQSLVCRLTGLPVANASMYDGASAAAEAVLLALGHTQRKQVWLSAGLNPDYRAVIKAYTSGLNIDLNILPESGGLVDDRQMHNLNMAEAACVVIQSPNFFGLIENLKAIGEIARSREPLFIAVANPLSLALLVSPGEVGADIAVGEMQVFGNALNFGGPYIGYFAAHQKYIRKIPGRLVARTRDIEGKTGYVLTLQTREQHIRRDKATSNICTNQALCALAATVHLTLLGEAGLKDAALMSARKAHYLAAGLQGLRGCSLPYAGRFFNEFVLKLPLPSERFLQAMQKEGILAGVPMSKFYPDRISEIIVAVTEKRSREELDRYLSTAGRIIG